MTQETSQGRLLDLYEQHQKLSRHVMAESTGELLDATRGDIAEKIEALLQTDPELRGTVEEAAPEALGLEDRLTEALNAQNPDSSLISQLEHERSEPKLILGRIALEFLDVKKASPAKKPELPEVLQLPAEIAAERLKGMELESGGKVIRITDTLPQAPEDNEKWARKPLFGENPVDVYVAVYRAGRMLFLRTASPKTCVRITGGGIVQTGEYLKNAKQVCDYLGLVHESTGSVEVDGGRLVVRLDD